MGKPQPCDVYFLPLRAAGRIDYNIKWQSILGVNFNVMIIGNQSKNGDPGAILDVVYTVFEKGCVAAEPVDDEAFNATLVLRRNDLKRADNLGENTAPVDIGDYNDRA